MKDKIAPQSGSTDFGSTGSGSTGFQPVHSQDRQDACPTSVRVTFPVSVRADMMLIRIKLNLVAPRNLAGWRA